jgi:transcription initiation factor IIE alpha subunit
MPSNYGEGTSPKIIQRSMKLEFDLMGGLELERYAKLYNCDVNMVRRNLKLLRELGMVMYVDREEGNHYVWQRLNTEDFLFRSNWVRHQQCIRNRCKGRLAH